MMRRMVSLGLLGLALAVLPGRSAEPASPALQRIAFGSCCHQNKSQAIWDVILATKPDLYIWLGDNIYGDTEDMKVLREKYAKLAAVPAYQQLLKTCPVLATWDDHDYGVNDGGANYPKRVESQQIFLDFLGVPKDSPRRQREGVYHSAIFGPPERRVQVILLDTRYHRSPLKRKAGKLQIGEGPFEPDPNPNLTMLGETQWQWLAEQLRVPAAIRIIGSSIQVAAEDHGWEKWMNLPRERERLFRLIADTRASGVVFISGDRHLAELSMIDGGVGYPLYDLTSSGLNQAFRGWRRFEPNRHRVATMNWGDNFGMILIDWDQKDPLIRLQIRDWEGEVTIQQRVPLRYLQPGALKSIPAKY